MTVFNQHLEGTLNKLTMTTLSLRNKPLIFNCYDSIIAIDRRTVKVVISRKTKQDYAATKGMRYRITVYLQMGHFFHLYYLPAGFSIRSICKRCPSDGALYSIYLFKFVTLIQNFFIVSSKSCLHKHTGHPTP